MSPFSINDFIGKLPEDVSVSEQDKTEWLLNPCTAVFKAMCLALMSQTFQESMQGKNMNDVCEARGRYHTAVEMFSIPERIPVIPKGGLTVEQASAMKRQIEEYIDAARSSSTGTDDSD